MDFLSFREEITKYIFAEDMLQKADIILIPGNAYPQNACLLYTSTPFLFVLIIVPLSF